MFPDKPKLTLDKAMSQAAKSGFDLVVLAFNQKEDELEIFSSFGDEPTQVAAVAKAALLWLSDDYAEPEPISELPPIAPPQSRLKN